MKVCIFSGVISIDKTNSDVRKKYLLERVKHLSNKDFKLNILSPLSSDPEYMDYINFQYDHYFCVRKKGLKLFSSMIFASSKLFTADCDIMHCLNYQSFLVAKLVNSLRKKRYILLFEAMGLAYAESTIDAKMSAKVKVLRPIINVSEKMAFKKSDGVIVYTDILKDYVADNFEIDRSKIYVVPHGVDLGNANLPIEDRYNLLSSLAQDSPKAVYVGSLSQLHGTPYLMEVALDLSVRRPDVVLLILGTGPLKDKFESFIEENQLHNVILTGYLPPEEVTFYLNSADVLLIPHSKCLQTELDPPTKLFEYMKAGKPIVSFNFKAIKEIIGEYAVLVEPDNSFKFTEGIIQVLDNKEHYSRLAQKAKLTVKQYSWKAAAEKQFQVYSDLIERFALKN